ncbi:hypothetical protein BDY21DRAFT_375351 [Lineolata rhizophorae]|uniref:Uncharacterized protein n=1 Tax=Lineolata rhizophorae TaxID=578093 RepID=A0A6A6NLP5_9PEZI|nr:hypothetical protein BDY21DRAFT_375351 [Lineolata rhizophorae]
MKFFKAFFVFTVAFSVAAFATQFLLVDETEYATVDETNALDLPHRPKPNTKIKNPVHRWQGFAERLNERHTNLTKYNPDKYYTELQMCMSRRPWSDNVHKSKKCCKKLWKHYYKELKAYYKEELFYLNKGIDAAFGSKWGRKPQRWD